MEEMTKEKMMEEMKKMGVEEEMMDDDSMSMLKDIGDDIKETMKMMMDKGMEETQVKEVMKKMTNMVIEGSEMEGGMEGGM